MKVNPISFGKTIKVQNEKLAKKIEIAANDVYSKEQISDSFKKQVREIFDDATPDSPWDEKVTYWETKNGFYVLSGKEAKEGYKFVAQWDDANIRAGEYYGACDFLDIAYEEHATIRDKQVNELIERTKEPYTLTQSPDGDRLILTTEPQTLPHGESALNSIYNDLVESGINEADAYMQAMFLEEELMEYSSQHN